MDRHMSRKKEQTVLDALPCAVTMGVRAIHEMLTMDLVDAAGERVPDEALEACSLFDTGLDLGVSEVRILACFG